MLEDLKATCIYLERQNMIIEGFVLAEINSIEFKFYLMFVLPAECLRPLRNELLLDLAGEPVFNGSLDSFA